MLLTNPDGSVAYWLYDVLVSNVFIPHVAPVNDDDDEDCHIDCCLVLFVPLVDDCVDGREYGLVDDDGLTLTLTFTLTLLTVADDFIIFVFIFNIGIVI